MRASPPRPSRGVRSAMLKRIVEFTLTRRPMVVAILLAFVVVGAVAFHRLNIEAYPDPSPPIMEIVTQNPGQSAEEIERYMTIPLEVALAGMPGLQYTPSLFGLSFIRVQLCYDTDYNFALQKTLNRL